MCGTKDEAETKIDRLIRSMDRLSDALEAASKAPRDDGQVKVIINDTRRSAIGRFGHAPRG